MHGLPMCYLGGAKLGSKTTVTVTIAQSGYPNGKFGFQGSSVVTVANPAILTTLNLNVIRIGGLVGQQVVCMKSC